MIKIKRINKEIIKPLKIPDFEDKRKPRGYDLLPIAYANVYACARKNTGKSSVIARLVMKCAGPETKVHIFCSTVHIDPTYIELGRWLDKHKIDYYPSTSIVDGKNDLLEDIMMEDEDFLDEGNKDIEDEKKVPVIRLLDLSDIPKGKVKKKRPSKYKELRRIFIFDDLSTEIKNSRSLKQLFKKNRHLRSMVLCASQYPNDIDPQSWSQLDYALLFKGHNDEKLEQIHLKLDLCISLELFKQIYRLCIGPLNEFNFLYITRFEDYRKNFNMLLLIEDDK
jgi:hypothetical protein